MQYIFRFTTKPVGTRVTLSEYCISFPKTNIQTLMHTHTFLYFTSFTLLTEWTAPQVTHSCPCITQSWAENDAGMGLLMYTCRCWEVGTTSACHLVRSKGNERVKKNTSNIDFGLYTYCGVDMLFGSLSLHKKITIFWKIKGEVLVES